MVSKSQKFISMFALIFGLSLIMGINVSANAQDVNDPNHKEVGVEIHLVPGGPNEAEIKSWIEKANEIWECSFVFVVKSVHTYEPNTPYDPNKNDAGKINIWGLPKAEVSTTAGTPAQDQDWDISGTDGGTVIDLVPGDGTNIKIKPSTLAHELGHVLGLEHGPPPHPDDSNNDPNNIMFPDNNDTNPKDGILESCHRDDDANAPPELQEKARKAREDLCAQAAIPKQEAAETYDPFDAVPDFIDLVWTQVRQLWKWGQRYLKLRLTTSGLSFTDVSTLGFYIESDNNQFTGDPCEGLDYCIGFNPLYEAITFAIYDNGWVSLDPTGIEYELTYAWKDASIPPVATGVTFTLPITLLERREGNLISFRAFGQSETEADTSPDEGLLSIKLSDIGVLYYDNFDGPAGTDLNDTTPDITTGGAKWLAGNDFDADGTVTYDGTSMGDSAYLPFVPQAGYIYELSAVIDCRVGAIRQNVNDWIALGFTRLNDYPEYRFFDDPPPGDPNAINRDPVYWGMTRTNQAVAPNYDQTFIGYRVHGGQNTATTSADNIKIVLNTTDPNGTWTVEWFYNNVSQRKVDVGVGFTPSAGGGPNAKDYFKYVALSHARPDGFVDDFMLTQLWPPDFVRDGVIDYKDLDVLTNNWLLAPPIDPNVDLHDDDKIDFRDFAEFGKYWGQKQ